MKIFSDSIIEIESDLIKFENHISNKSMEFEIIDIENESILQEDNVLISKNNSKRLQNNSINNHLFNSYDEINSNLNSAEYSNESFL